MNSSLRASAIQFHGFDRLAFLLLLQVEVVSLDHRGLQASGRWPAPVIPPSRPAHMPSPNTATASRLLGSISSGHDIRRRILEGASGRQSISCRPTLRRPLAGRNDGIERKFERKKRFRQLGFVGLAQRAQEFLLLVFDDQLDERCERSVARAKSCVAVDDVDAAGGGLRRSIWRMYFMVSGTVVCAPLPQIMEEAVDCRAG